MTKFTTEIGHARHWAKPRRSGLPLWTTCAWPATWCSATCFALHGPVALRESAAGNTDPFYTVPSCTARFYFAKLFPETAALMRTARAGGKVLMDGPWPRPVRRPHAVNFKILPWSADAPSRSLQLLALTLGLRPGPR